MFILWPIIGSSCICIPVAKKTERTRPCPHTLSGKTKRPKKRHCRVKTVLFQFYLIPQNPWIYSCWAGNCSCDHLECRVLALTTLFAFFKIDLDRPLFLFWSGYEVARGRISVNMTGKLVFFSLKAELCFLAKHVCLRFARHFNYKRIKLYSQRHNATTIIMQFFYVNDVTWPKHFY